MRLIKPTKDGVLVDPIKPPEKLQSGLIVTDQIQDAPAEGIVVEVGAGARLKNGTVRPPPVQIGDRVFFNRFNGTEVKIRNRIYKLIPANEVLAIIEQE